MSIPLPSRPATRAPAWQRWAWVLATCLAAWLVLLLFMADMDHGPGGALHELPFFVAGWVLMLVAMMLPSELTYIGAFCSMLAARNRDGVVPARTVLCFVGGYGIAWLAYGVILGLTASLSGAAIRHVGFGAIAGSSAGPALAGAVLVVAGAYQVSPLKQACLTHCRSPLAFFARHWQAGRAGAVAMGIRHGLVCVGCCWALMAVMFVVGTMNLTWMALLTLLMFAEKVLPQGQRLVLPTACFLVAMGLRVALYPQTAPLPGGPLVFGASICRAL